ncbi:MAG: hypothetical protein NC123_17240 [Butyrivibrio sp.]|nr:hypothetical protein [Butyrivibrio sp.]
MEQKNPIRLLKADEIECRVSIIKENGLSLLLYKDARVDQKILDETFGAFGWKRSHQCIEGNLYCTVEIYDKETGQWVGKQDVGTTGYAEKEKSQASDSFKRACFNWGIGRELYTAPFIWIPAGETEIKSKDGRCYCDDRFSVSSIGYNDSREIDSLVIVNKKGQAVYELKQGNASGTSGSRKGKGADKDSGKGKTGQKMAEKEAKNTSLTKEQMQSLRSELDRTGVTMEAVQKRYKIGEAEGMSEEVYTRLMNALKRTKSAEAA